MKPWTISLLILAGSLALTAFLWMMGFPFFFLFVFIPVIPFLFNPLVVRRCPVCGWETTGNETFCPYDATPLENIESYQR